MRSFIIIICLRYYFKKSNILKRICYTFHEWINPPKTETCSLLFFKPFVYDDTRTLTRRSTEMEVEYLFPRFRGLVLERGIMYFRRLIEYLKFLAKRGKH